MGGLFVLDAVQARAPLGDAGKSAVAVAAMGGTVRFVLTTTALAILGVCSWKAGLRTSEGGRPFPLLVPRDRAPLREPLQ